jgi:hypothetical protein
MGGGWFPATPPIPKVAFLQTPSGRARWREAVVPWAVAVAGVWRAELAAAGAHGPGSSAALGAHEREPDAPGGERGDEHTEARHRRQARGAGAWRRAHRSVPERTDVVRWLRGAAWARRRARLLPRRPGAEAPVVATWSSAADARRRPCDAGGEGHGAGAGGGGDVRVRQASTHGGGGGDGARRRGGDHAGHPCLPHARRQPPLPPARTLSAASMSRAPTSASRASSAGPRPPARRQPHPSSARRRPHPPPARRPAASTMPPGACQAMCGRWGKRGRKAGDRNK